MKIASPLAGTDLFLCALFGGIISDIGSSLAIRHGGAMDGIEVVAVIFAKALGISVGTFVLAHNVLLYIICICGVVVNRFQIVKIKNLVKTIDSKAYITITPVSDLLHGSVENG